MWRILAGRDEFWQGRHGRHGKTSPGWVWQGPARARLGEAGKSRLGPAKLGSAWHGEAKRGAAGTAGPGAIR